MKRSIMSVVDLLSSLKWRFSHQCFRLLICERPFTRAKRIMSCSSGIDDCWSFWWSVSSSSFLFLQMYASQYFPQITELLRRLPRVILLMLKTNDCLRAVNRSLVWDFFQPLKNESSCLLNALTRSYAVKLEFFNKKIEEALNSEFLNP